MQPPERMTAVIDRKRYSTATATLICGDDWWDGHNHERSGTQTFLYRTPRGAYFFVGLSQWQGTSDSITPCSQDEAVTFYEQCAPRRCTRVEYAEAFPGVTVEEA